MNDRQSVSTPHYRTPEDIARSVSDLTSQEAECRDFFSQRRPASIGLMEDAFDFYLDALHIANGHGWKSYSEQAVILWSFMTFHTARAAFLLALTGYFAQFYALERSLADQACLCWLFHVQPEYAQRAIVEGGRVLDTPEILGVVHEGPWPGYERLHAFVHARAEAIDSYMQPAPLDEIKLTFGPRRDVEWFDDAVADITLFLLFATQTLGSAWEPLRQQEAWRKKFRPLRDRCLAFVQQRYEAPS